MNQVTLENELKELENIHRRLVTNISEGYTNYLDDVNLGKMKQHNLIIKRKIETLKTKLNSPISNVLR